MNHFLEYDKGIQDGNPVQAFLIHTGSRNLGKKVWEKWHNIAYKVKLSKAEEREITSKVRERTADKTKIREEIDKAIEEYRKSMHPGYLEGENLRAYLTDMAICQAYARYNHMIIRSLVEEIHTSMVKGSKVTSVINTTHNYIDFDTIDGIPIIRKGAVRANEDELFILPFNMRDGVAICRGKGNSDWNYSCSHGAGRKMSRAKAKETLDLKEFERTMEGIYSTTINRSTIDEAPMAYKPKDEIIRNIEPTCDVLYFMKPVINIKAGSDSEIPSWKELKKNRKK